MFGKNTAVFGIDPTHDSADAAGAPPAPMPARAATRGPAAMTAPVPPPAPAAAFVPNSWPNSGFRNIRRRGTRGG